MLDSAPSTTSNRLVFARELARFGPQQATTCSAAEAQDYCRCWATSHYENFTVVSWLLPKRLRQDFFNIYAYCRWSDNLADEISNPQESLRLLDWWEQELQRCYHDTPSHPVMIALQQTIHQHALPIEPLADLLSAFRQDQVVNRYQTEAQLLDYCRRSANPVGRILLHLAGVSHDDGRSFLLSDKICSGLQLTNFCQDMSRDAASDRIYVPEEFYSRHAVTESMILQRRATPELRSLLAEWTIRSHQFFVDGKPLVDLVPRWLRTDIDLFVRGGQAILNRIEACGFDVWSARPSLSKWTKLRILLASLLANHGRGRRAWIDAAQTEVPSHG